MDILCSGQDLLFRNTFQALTRQLMRGIGFATDVTNDAPAATAALTNLKYGEPKTVA